MLSYTIQKLERKDYPEKLYTIKNSPKQIYFIGNINLLFKKSFGIVGTRKITAYGKKNCQYFTKEFVLRDIPIISRNGNWYRYHST